MGVKKALLLSIAALVFVFSAYSGELAEEEAANYYNEGVKDQSEGNYFKATTAYQKVLSMAPNNLDYQKFIANNMGVMYMKKRDMKMAEWSFREALSIDPSYKPAQMNLGLMYDLKGDRVQALEYWVKVFNLEAMKPKDFVVQGECQKAE